MAIDSCLLGGDGGIFEILIFTTFRLAVGGKRGRCCPMKMKVVCGRPINNNMGDLLLILVRGIPFDFQGGFRVFCTQVVVFPRIEMDFPL